MRRVECSVSFPSALLAMAVVLAAAPSAHAQLMPPDAPPETSWPRFVCEDGDCPAGVGALTTRGRSGETGFCTATLVAPDRVVTAAHCVAERRFATMHFFLPDPHAVTLAWAAVEAIEARETLAFGADHAVLILDRRIDATPLAIARQMPTPDSTLTVVRASPHADRTVFLRRERCHVMPQALSTDRIVPTSMVRIAGCTILPGNSGAPMLDASGRVVAVISSALEPDGVAPLLAPWLLGPAPYVGTISSLACLPRSVVPGELPELCARLSRAPDRGLLPSTVARDAAVDAQREALTERLVEWDRGEDTDRVVGWDLERRVRGHRTYAVPVPGCIDVAELARTGRIDAEGRFSLTIRVPTWRADAFLGGDARMVPITERVSRVRMRIDGRFDEARSSATIRVRAGRTRVREHATVGACAD
jgi:protease YdgD